MKIQIRKFIPRHKSNSKHNQEITKVALPLPQHLITNQRKQPKRIEVKLEMTSNGFFPPLHPRSSSSRLSLCVPSSSCSCLSTSALCTQEGTQDLLLTSLCRRVSPLVFSCVQWLQGGHPAVQHFSTSPCDSALHELPSLSGWRSPSQDSRWCSPGGTLVLDQEKICSISLGAAVRRG